MKSSGGNVQVGIFFGVGNALGGATRKDTVLVGELPCGELSEGNYPDEKLPETSLHTYLMIL